MKTHPYEKITQDHLASTYIQQSIYSCGYYGKSSKRIWSNWHISTEYNNIFTEYNIFNEHEIQISNPVEETPSIRQADRQEINDVIENSLEDQPLIDQLIDYDNSIKSFTPSPSLFGQICGYQV